MKRWRRRWLWIGILLLLLGMGGWWWLTRPAGLRLVGAYPAAKYFTPSRAGFLLREEPDLLVLRDWHTGNIIWQVRTDGPKLPPAPSPDEFLRNRMGWSTYDLSADGRTLAVVIAERPHLHCYTWRDGKLTGDILLRNQQKVFGYGNLRALDDGRVFYWGYFALPQPVILIQGDRVVAKGNCPPILIHISADGRLALQYQYKRPTSYYSTIQVQGGAIRFIRQPAVLTDNTFMLDNTIYCDDGRVFTDKGLLRTDAPWTQSQYSWDSRRFEFAHTVQFNKSVPGKSLHARVWNPLTGKAWTFSPPSSEQINYHLWYLASADGAHAMVYRTLSSSEQLRRFNRIPFLDRLPRVTHGEIRLYQRPGRLYAQQAFARNVISTPRGRCQLMGAYPSPDGQSVVLEARPLNTRKRVYCLMRVK